MSPADEVEEVTVIYSSLKEVLRSPIHGRVLCWEVASDYNALPALSNLSVVFELEVFLCSF